MSATHRDPANDAEREIDSSPDDTSDSERITKRLTEEELHVLRSLMMPVPAARQPDGAPLVTIATRPDTLRSPRPRERAPTATSLLDESSGNDT